MLAKLIAECSDYDFKREVEVSKPRSWLKSVSAFANGVGGSLYFGVNDNGVAIGLKDVKSSCDKISELVNQRIEPKPIYRIIPFLEDGMNLIELRVAPSQSTPYYYRSDGVRMAYIRSGNESIEAPNYILNELILKGTGRTFDSIVTGHRIEDFSFAVLKAKFLERTGTVFSDDDFLKGDGKDYAKMRSMEMFKDIFIQLIDGYIFVCSDLEIDDHDLTGPNGMLIYKIGDVIKKLVSCIRFIREVLFIY